MAMMDEVEFIRPLSQCRFWHAVLSGRFGFVVRKQGHYSSLAQSRGCYLNVVIVLIVGDEATDNDKGCDNSHWENSTPNDSR